ncbi:MAG: T9SS type A sorting domain-containing protein [Candidatus Krumholzibacteriota bacterium]|nr:T9SS type A sorting domain-containing protein [Candidatus Krumholzibacteriota bacterium]
MAIFSPVNAQRAAPLIVDHNCTDITLIPEAGIINAKTVLHIVYGHTSHGSQITDGMTGLVGFANGGGLGLSLAADIFAWNNGGSDGALDLHDEGMYGDVGYYPDWVNETVDYIENNPDVNVIVWSWCGQAGDKYVAGTLYSEYLAPMSQLEIDYPDLTFVYMTGHMDHYADADIKAANQMIREYCIENNKVLYDFADIECYDPDGTFFEYPDDDCDYYSSEFGPLLGNWALEWQDSHPMNVDWYDCNAEHSQPLNGNLKAYAAWWLWVRLSGYGINTGIEDIPTPFTLGQNFPNPFNPATTIKYSVSVKSRVSLAIYDVNGRLIDRLIDRIIAPGSYVQSWDGTDTSGRRVKSGIYFYRLRSNGSEQTKKMVLLQ